MHQVEPHESGKSVNIMAIDGVHWKRAEKTLEESIVVKQVEIPKNTDIDFDSEDFQDFRSELENNKIVRIDHKKSWTGIWELIGAKDDATKAKMLTKEFLKSKQRSDQWHVNYDVSSKLAFVIFTLSVTLPVFQHPACFPAPCLFSPYKI